MPKKVTKKDNKPTDVSSFFKSLEGSGKFAIKKEDKFYSTGDYALDYALGGGIPSGQVCAFYGPSGSCKTLGALQVAKNVCDEGRAVFYLDTETKISDKALEMIGLSDDPNFTIMQIREDATLEDAIDTIQQGLASDLFGLIVLDSLDSTTTDEQEERDIHAGSKMGGYKAKILSEQLPKISTLAASHDCTLIVVQQVRDRPDAMFGNPETRSGGKAMTFYTTLELRFSGVKEGTSAENGKTVWQGVNIRVDKNNQGARPDSAINTRFYIGDDQPWGIDSLTSMYSEARRLNILAPETPTGNKHVPCDALCELMGTTPEELTFPYGKTVKEAIADLDHPELANAVRVLIERSDGKTPYTRGEVADVAAFEEV